jgi:hypothetical protein
VDYVKSIAKRVMRIRVKSLTANTGTLLQTNYPSLTYCTGMIFEKLQDIRA